MNFPKEQGKIKSLSYFINWIYKIRRMKLEAEFQKEAFPFIYTFRFQAFYDFSFYSSAIGSYLLS